MILGGGLLEDNHSTPERITLTASASSTHLRDLGQPSTINPPEYSDRLAPSPGMYLMGFETNLRLIATNANPLLEGPVRHFLSDGGSDDAIALFSVASSRAASAASLTVSPRYLLWMNLLRIIASGVALAAMICITPARHLLLRRSFAPAH